jgi:NADH:ubiquinone oxidoreductase subunit K
MLDHALIIGAYLFCIGIYGLVTSRNMVRALMCLELMLNGVNMNLVAFATYLDPEQLKGQTFAIFIIAIAAAEAAIGLAIVLNIYRNRNSVRIDQFDLLKW